MVRRAARALALLLVLLMVTVPVASLASQAWGNGSSTSVEFTDFGIHDITCDIALRTATYTSPEFLTWMTDWYIRNETDYGYSFDGDNDLSGPTDTDNINAYTDDPDSSLQDWDNHTLYLHPRTGWDPPDGDTARRVSQLYNQTVYHIYRWLMNGSVRYDRDQHYAAYYGGLISHYIMDLTQFGHTDWTRLDHSNPPDFDPQGATYHSYYEARTWTDQALRTIHVDLMGYALPEPLRVLDPAQTVRDLAGFVNGRHGPDVQFEDIDQSMVTLGSTYALMLENFTSNWDAGVTYNSARGFDEDLWNLTEENLVAGMNNLTNLWTSAYLDARDRFLEDAADIVVELIGLYPNGTIFEGQNVAVSFDVYNRGKVRTPSFQVSGYLDGVDEIGKAFLELVPGQHETVSFWFFPSAGDHSLSLVGDATQGTPESNESNNIVTVDFYVEAEHHESKLSSEHTVIEILQEDTGWFDLTLENLGNRGDVFDISVDAYPGTIDFSLTLPVEKVHVPALSNRTFRIDVTTILDNPVGSRYFVVTATGENSSVAIRLTVLIKERQLAPFIEVEYAFFTNISLPISFDASGSWDHNGDEISFDWDFGDGTFGTGAVIEHAWQEEGVYVIILNASDGQLHRERTLEVSVEDAIPPVPQLTVTDVDFNAARFEWTTWESTRYFEEYRLYIADVPDPGDIISDANLFQTIELFYVDNATLRVPPEDILFVVLVTVNINGDEYRSNVAEVVLELRTKTYQEPGLLYAAEVFASSDMLSTIELKWREWQPLLVESSNNYVPNLISTKQVDGGQPTTGSVEIGQGVPGYLFADLSPDEYMLWVDYVSGIDSIMIGPILVDLTGTNTSLRFIHLPPALNRVVGKELKLPIELTWISITDGYLTVDWGDESGLDIWPYILRYERQIYMTIKHTYIEEGNFTITVNDTRNGTIIWMDDGWQYHPYDMVNDTIHTSAHAIAVITPAEDDDETTQWTDYVIAIALILFIATIGVLAGHVTGYYRIGSGGERKVDPSDEGSLEEMEPEQTAEEIISELEEDMGDEDDEYLDHEPTVSELEAMIPRPPRDG